MLPTVEPVNRRLIAVLSCAAALIVVAAVTTVVLVYRSDRSVVVDGRASGAVTVRKGTWLRVNFGTVNTSVGDMWTIVTAPDSRVLRDRGTDHETSKDCGGSADEGWSGCDQTLHWQFESIGPGRTSVRFQYCYRSRPPDCEAEPSRGPAQPVELTITVN